MNSVNVPQVISDLIDSAEGAEGVTEEFRDGYVSGLVDLMHILKAVHMFESQDILEDPELPEDGSLPF